jgi:uncharacterized membrane protein
MITTFTVERETVSSTELRRTIVRAPRPRRSAPKNVNTLERWASVLGGAALATYAARRRGVPGAALALLGGELIRRGATGHCMVYDALGVSTAGGERLEKQHGEAAVLDASNAVRVDHTVTIDRPAETLYAYWHHFENLPAFMSHLERIEVISPKRSRWHVRGPGGQHIAWNAEIINDIPNELIAWKSSPNALVPNAGSIHFIPLADGGRTDVKIELEYDPPTGRFGATLAKLLGQDPADQVRDDLLRFKRIMETPTRKALARETRARP